LGRLCPETRKLLNKAIRTEVPPYWESFRKAQERYNRTIRHCKRDSQRIFHQGVNDTQKCRGASIKLSLRIPNYDFSLLCFLMWSTHPQERRHQPNAGDLFSGSEVLYEEHIAQRSLPGLPAQGTRYWTLAG
jgi:hypothetical protein